MNGESIAGDTRRSFDPRVAIVATALVVAGALFAVTSKLGMVLVLVYVTGLYLLGGGGVGEGLTHLQRLWFFLLLIVAINGVLISGTPVVTVAGRDIVSVEGLFEGAFFCLRLVVLYFSMAALLVLAPAERFAQGTFAMVRPVSERLARRLALYGFLSLGFVPLFAREFERIRLAQMFRGADLHGGLRRRLLSVRPLLLPLVLSAIHRSHQLAVVVELRGLKDRMGSAIALPRPGLRDLALILATLGVLAAAIAI